MTAPALPPDIAAAAPDPNIEALRECIVALSRSSSRRMLRANLNFLRDYFIDHPSQALPENLR